ncbi:mitochondrion organization and biogenesis protein [Ophiocordyceps camponoti-floridani]|uniref:Required for respiratory growth protein 9, mitochondrial n=1 Tax=Ophiocordyceps camponoti-floridani TaxID=2030778 RepID=A0A8H4QC95_9HYPO|nr:mitochondrion organization and biogenesis protein [Ophiocordyceps camponoti-floridani]
MKKEASSRSSTAKSPAASSTTFKKRPQGTSREHDGSSKPGTGRDTDQTKSARPENTKKTFNKDERKSGGGAFRSAQNGTAPVFEKRKKEDWMIQKEALKAKFPEGWKPRKRLSPDALIGIRALHAQFPDIYTTEHLSNKFKVSAEAIRRILKSNFRPDDAQEAERRERWERRGLQIWEHKAALGIKPPRKWREEGVVRDASHHERVLRASRREKQLEEEEIRTYQKQYLERRAQEKAKGAEQEAASRRASSGT